MAARPDPVATIDYSSGVDSERARQLLADERTRIEQALAHLEGEGPLESDARVEPGDRDDEDLYQDEFDEGRRDDLQVEVAALERAEARLAAGTYGLSVESGEPIPDARLEARPLAERTVQEEERRP
jgi:DnaK suppressor protein